MGYEPDLEVSLVILESLDAAIVSSIVLSVVVVNSVVVLVEDVELIVNHIRVDFPSFPTESVV